jgi:hypothetical protein
MVFRNLCILGLSLSSSRRGGLGWCAAFVGKGNKCLDFKQFYLLYQQFWDTIYFGERSNFSLLLHLQSAEFSGSPGKIL